MYSSHLGAAAARGSNHTGLRRTLYSCLIIERDGEFASAAVRDLPDYGFKPFLARSPEVALGILRQWTFDAALIDADGFGARYVDVLRRLGPQFGFPVILLSEPQDERDQILSLESGATAVVSKPASSRLLAAKMQRLIEVARCKEGTEDDQVRLGPLTMYARSGIATVDDTPVKLTTHQFDLLFLLASRAGQFVDRETIAMRLKGACEAIGRSTDVHVYRIRRKLKDHGIDCLRLDTVYGRGYMLTLDAGATAGPSGGLAPLRLG